MEPPPKSLFFQSQYIHKYPSRLTLLSVPLRAPILLLPFPSQCSDVEVKITVDHQQKDGTYPSLPAHMPPTLQLHSCHGLTPKEQIIARGPFSPPTCCSRLQHFRSMPAHPPPLWCLSRHCQLNKNQICFASAFHPAVPTPHLLCKNTFASTHTQAAIHFPLNHSSTFPGFSISCPCISSLFSLNWSDPPWLKATYSRFSNSCKSAAKSSHIAVMHRPRINDADSTSDANTHMARRHL